MVENINYPMFGKDYFKRPQYSADMIHEEAMKWLDKQDGKQPFFGIFTYTLPHAELAQHTGMSERTVNRALSELRERGVIHTEYGKVFFDDKALRQMIAE